MAKIPPHPATTVPKNDGPKERARPERDPETKEPARSWFGFGGWRISTDQEFVLA